MSDNDVTKMKVADLKRELKIRNLSTVGNKNELVDRLQSALLDGDSTLDDSALNADDILDDDVLNDDDLDEEDEKSLLHEDSVLKTPPETKPTDSVDTASTKKIILKRKLNVNITGPSSMDKTSDDLSALDGTLASPAKIAKTTITGPSTSDSTSSSVVTVVVATIASTPDATDGDKKVVKLSELTAKERLEMRAKKFGVPIAPESAKLARSERFGTNDATVAASNNAKSGSTIKDNKEPVSVDTLKKRAERFGGSVSKSMTKIENNEKLQKRNERFGAAADSSAQVEAPTVVPVEASNDEFAEKARQRLERFKPVVA